MEQRNEMLKEMRVSEKRRGKMVRKKNWDFFFNLMHRASFSPFGFGHHNGPLSWGFHFIFLWQVKVYT